MKHSTRAILFAAGAAAVLAVLVWQKQGGTKTSDRPGAAAALGDPLLAEFRVELLDTAFQAATALPLDPHRKNRARAQESVADAALELGQVERATGYARRIEGWRKGHALAAIALRQARRGETDKAKILLAEAQTVADSAVDPNDQEWRRERVRARIASARAALEGAPQRTPVANALTAIDTALSGGTFDDIQGALDAALVVYAEEYEDSEKRSAIEAKVRSGSTKVPRGVGVRLLLGMADAASAHKDETKARSLLAEARETSATIRWSPEEKVTLLARLASCYQRTGDRETARGLGAEALNLFREERSKIIDVFRAECLRPLAEAYQGMGDRDRALDVYVMALEESVVNPNSRPRAEDLVGTCVSMAKAGAEPDKATRARIQGILTKLGSPW